MCMYASSYIQHTYSTHTGGSRHAITPPIPIPTKVPTARKKRIIRLTDVIRVRGGRPPRRPVKSPPARAGRWLALTRDIVPGGPGTAAGAGAEREKFKFSICLCTGEGMCVCGCVCVRPFRQGMARGERERERERARDGGKYRGQIGREGSIIMAVQHTT
jgi:hypothetical protein